VRVGYRGDVVGSHGVGDAGANALELVDALGRNRNKGSSEKSSLSRQLVSRYRLITAPGQPAPSARS